METGEQIDDEEGEILDIIEDVMTQFSHHGYNLDKVASLMIQTGAFYFEERVAERKIH